MKNSIFSRVKLLTGVMFVASLLMLTGCFNPSKPETPSLPEGVTSLSADDTLIGTWEGGSAEYPESYTITTTSFSNGYYEGNELKVEKTSDTAGYIYIKYTKSMNADWTYSETAPDVGKWYAISYKNLTNTTISLSGAYSSAEGAKTSTETLEEAKKEFTIENGYFGFYSELTKKVE